MTRGQCRSFWISKQNTCCDMLSYKNCSNYCMWLSDDSKSIALPLPRTSVWAPMTGFNAAVIVCHTGGSGCVLSSLGTALCCLLLCLPWLERRTWTLALWVCQCPTPCRYTRVHRPMWCRWSSQMLRSTLLKWVNNFTVVNLDMCTQTYILTMVGINSTNQYLTTCPGSVGDHVSELDGADDFRSGEQHRGGGESEGVLRDHDRGLWYFMHVCT